jgi:hypothetical protein
MSTFDMDSVADPLSLRPGTYAVEITGCEEKTSSSGKRYWNVTLRAIDFNTKLCHSVFMLEGDGASITKARLSALGFTGAVEPGHLFGKRTWATVKEKPANGQYAKSLELDIKAGQCGFHKEKPGQIVEASKPDDVPF